MLTNIRYVNLSIAVGRHMGQKRFFIGLDDTDFGDSVGTGALARELMVHLERDLGADSHGVTRHQLLVHPEIPYTSHNSAACLEVECDATLESLVDTCSEFVQFLFHPGADPGLSIATPSGPRYLLTSPSTRIWTEPTVGNSVAV